MILNLPATVEMLTARTMCADVIEWFRPHHQRIGTPLSSACTRATTRYRRRRPPNWPCRPVPTRVEGTPAVRQRRAHRQRRHRDAGHEPLLAGHHDPALDFGDIEKVRRVAEYARACRCTHAIPSRGPGVHRLLPRSHQDAIKKGMAAIGDDYDEWEVPCLPIDPKHTDPYLRGDHPGRQPVRQGRVGLPDGHRPRGPTCRSGSRSNSPKRVQEIFRGERNRHPVGQDARDVFEEIALQGSPGCA